LVVDERTPGYLRTACDCVSEIPMTRNWIAMRLRIASASYVSHLLARP
jgi:hypothetical protein